MFEIMAKQPNNSDLPSRSVDEERCSVSESLDEKPACLLDSTENDIRTFENNKVFTLQSDDSNACGRAMEMGEEPPQPAPNPGLKVGNAGGKNPSSDECGLKSKHVTVNDCDDKENAVVASAPTTTDIAEEEAVSNESSLQDCCINARIQSDESAVEMVRRAQDEGHVDVIFPGTVTQDGCCRFVSEILKCILYQRQQLPMTYDQLVYSQKKQQEKHAGSRRPGQSADLAWRKCQQTMQELEEVLQQLEVLYSLSRVPRVLLLLGGSVILPKELYEINMEALVVASGDRCLRVSSCLRQLFRTLFVADLLSDTRPVRLMPTTVLVLAHRNCGVEWFRPKLQFKVPTRVKKQVISLSTDSRSHKELTPDWQDYVWFQAPMTIKGFNK
eukprot:XP_003964279.2 PREDICTED: MAD2L1-binding protein [Takifugu rubripes]